MTTSLDRSDAFELIVLDPAGRIRFTDSQAAAWLTEGQTLCRRGANLSAPGRAGRDALDRLVSATLADAAAGAPAVPRVVPLPRPARLPLVAVVLPIPCTRRYADFELGAAILLRDPEVVCLPPRSIVRETFGLTNAEAEVALALGAGRGLKEIAVERAVSLNTIRTLTGRVFGKMGCRRQAEVVRLLGALNEAMAAVAGVGAGLAWLDRAGDAVAARAARSRFDALFDLPLRAPPNQHATIVACSFAPGDDTGYHLHGCGHELVCVLDGALTMEDSAAAPTRTRVGEAVNVPPGVAHRGVNADTTRTLALFHIGIGPAGSIDRREL